MRTLFPVVLSLTLTGCTGEAGWIDDRFFVRTDDGTDLFVHAVGDGMSNEFVLFLHSPDADSPPELSPAAPLLHEQLVMVYLDQRGQGASEGTTPPEGLTLDLLAEDVVTVLEVLDQLYLDDRTGNPRLWLMGHSWGGLVGPQVLLETDASELIAGWIEVAGAHDLPRMYSDSRTRLLETAEAELEGKPDEDTKAAWEEVRTFAQEAPGAKPSLDELLDLHQLARSTSELMDEIKPQEASRGARLDWMRQRPDDALATSMADRRMLRALLEPELDRSWSARYRELTLPTLLLWGRHDLAVPLSLGEDVQLRIASEVSELVVLDGSGHEPMDHEPEAYARSIVDFVGETP